MGAALSSCPSGAIETFLGNGKRITDDIYETSVRGIGYRVYYYISDQSQQTAPITYQNPYPSGVLVYPMNTDSHPQGTNVRTRIELVATGEPIASGTIDASQVFGAGWSSSAPSPSPNYYRVQMVGTVTVAHPTCSIMNPAALNVMLPEVSASHLAASGMGARRQPCWACPAARTATMRH